MYLLYLILLYGGLDVQAQMHGNQAIPLPQEAKPQCVSGFCLPREYKKLETPKEG